MKTNSTETEEFGVNFFKAGHGIPRGIIDISVPKYNSNGHIVSFEDKIARFKEVNGRLVATNDEVESFSNSKLAYIYIALHGNKPIANKVKILPPLKAKLIKYE